MNSRPPPAARSYPGRDPNVVRGLDSIHRELRDVEQSLDQLLAGDAGEGEGGGDPPERGASGPSRRVGAGPLDAALTPAQLAELAAWQDSGRMAWEPDDVLVVGLAGIVGALASVQDTALDVTVRRGLGQLKRLDMVGRWERDARGLPIDFTGPKFGGPGHRVRSSGHDLARPLSALRQLRNGRFEGVVWSDGTRTTFTTDAGSYVPVEALGEALTVWMKHLFADVVTPMSLPLPAWSLLYELDDRRLRQFAHRAYEGSSFGEGLNLRSGAMTTQLSVLSTEAIVRTHMLAKAYDATRRLQLGDRERTKLTELLIAGHSLVAAACLGTTLVRAYACHEGPLAVRHLNVPVLVRAGHLAARARAEAKERQQGGPPSWGELASLVSSPATMPDAARVNQLAEDAG